MVRQAKSVRAGTISSVAPMPTPPRGRRELKRDAILGAAKDLFFTRGYTGTSMNDIVERVGGSKATLYSHFSSKDELLLALIKSVTESATAEALSVDPSQDFHAYLRTIGRVAMRSLTSPDTIGLQRLAASEAIRFPECGQTYFEQGIRPGLEQGAKVFAAAMDRGVLRRRDPFVALNQFMEMCAGWMWRRQIWNIAPRPTEEEIGSNVDAAADTLMHGYALRRSTTRDKSSPPRKNSSAPPPPGENSAPLFTGVPTRRELKRTAIIAAAKDLFFRQGYSAVSMDQVVARVGGSKATLYSHFASKQDLLMAVVREVEGEQPLIPKKNKGNFQSWLHEFGRTAFLRLTSYEFISLQRLAAGEAVTMPEVGKAFFEAGVIPAFSQFVGEFHTAMDAGVLRRASAALAAEHFIEMCTGRAMRNMIWGFGAPLNDKDLDDQIAQAVETFMDGYSAAPKFQSGAA